MRKKNEYMISLLIQCTTFNSRQQSTVVRFRALYIYLSTFHSCTALASLSQITTSLKHTPMFTCACHWATRLGAALPPTPQPTYSTSRARSTIRRLLRGKADRHRVSLSFLLPLDASRDSVSPDSASLFLALMAMWTSLSTITTGHPDDPRSL